MWPLPIPCIGIIVIFCVHVFMLHSYLLQQQQPTIIIIAFTTQVKPIYPSTLLCSYLRVSVASKIHVFWFLVAVVVVVLDLHGICYYYQTRYGTVVSIRLERVQLHKQY